MATAAALFVGLVLGATVSSALRGKPETKDTESSSTGGAKARRRMRRRRSSGGEQLTKADILKLRQQLFCGAQSVSYANSDPLLMIRGEGSKMFDDRGLCFLDTRNNVAYLGHSHPAVVEAVSSQVAALNTNSRYLHPNMVRLAQKLLAKCPPKLCKAFFVNSGSEANDLALRLARVYTGKEDVVVIDHAYHGHTVEVINISPYKFNHLGGPGQQPHVHVVEAPDTFRGRHRCDSTAGAAGERAAGARYAEQVEEVCKKLRKSKGGVSAFFMESGMSVAGVILPPEGYLQKCYAAVREAGGICVADEVQVGFGRFGSTFWGFEQQGVVPDVITMGKPFGNGMPLAAVVTTAEVADAFHNGLEYFNTFGGNPVACAAGIAVLETIEAEGLQAHALDVGCYVRDGLRAMQADFPIIGEVRGAGLFIGIDFVADPETRKPATGATSVIVTQLKEQHHILTSIDAPHDNVMVMKPPMVFSRTDADQFLGALRLVLAELPAADMDAERTPT